MDDQWDRKKIREVLDELKKLPDFDQLPLPRSIYKEFNIPMPKYICDSLVEYLGEHNKTIYHSHVQEFETRENDGKVRPLLEPEVVPVEIVTGKPIRELELTPGVCAPVEALKEKTADESLPTIHETSDDSTESTETKPQESKDSPNLHWTDAALNIDPF